jgi:hypothetical protein
MSQYRDEGVNSGPPMDWVSNDKDPDMKDLTTQATIATMQFAINAIASQFSFNAFIGLISADEEERAKARKELRGFLATMMTFFMPIFIVKLMSAD